MTTMNPTPFFLWSGVAMIVLDHYGLTAAGLSLIVLGLLSFFLSRLDNETRY